MTAPSTDYTPAAEPVRSVDDLLNEFHASETPREDWLIGAEAEKFGIDAVTGAPLEYEGPRGVLRIFEELITKHGWQPVSEVEGGPTIALHRGKGSVTLEPGAQFELSGEPMHDLHQVRQELDCHMAEIADVSAKMNLAWLGIGFHPLARLDQLPWVPKQRYGVMRVYLPTQGDGALNMMQRTATVQGNYDFCDEEDALRKLRVMLRLSPIMNTLTANSPLKEGHLTDYKSFRADVWTRMDPTRSGLIAPLWQDKHLGYLDYVEACLDAGMFFFKRDGEMIPNTGQTFRQFMTDGFEGQFPTIEDWRSHLSTLFPEARLKRTLEVRCFDSAPRPLATVAPALCTGLLYDEKSLAQMEELTAGWDWESVERMRPVLAKEGLKATLLGRSVRDIGERVLEAAWDGLARRARTGRDELDERVYLMPLMQRFDRGRVPADDISDGYAVGDPVPVSEIYRRTRF
jgi:glutamate--cysteine ligase